MVETWRAFLEQAGARFDGDTVAGFSESQAEAKAALDGDTVADLSHFGLLRASGEDAATFLQGQFTNDIRQVTPEHSQVSAFCTPKGRMQAAMRIFLRDDAYHLRLPGEMVESLRERLAKFILMSRVTIEDASDDLVRIGVSGPGATAGLRDAAGSVPDEVDQAVQADTLTIVRVPDGGHPRYEVYGPVDAVQALWSRLDRSAGKPIGTSRSDARGGRARDGAHQGFTPVGADAWALLDIHAGLPNILPPTEEAFVPQMANLHLVNGVSFRKGCYTGQEIVARMQYLGQLKRRMYRAHVDVDTPPRAGDELFAADSRSGQGAGKVVDARPAPDGGYDLLAVVEVSSAEQGDVHLGSADGPALTFHDLPYGWETEI